MNTIDLIKQISNENNITTGRAEMILSIIFERMTEKLKKEGVVDIPNFGRFEIISKIPGNGNFTETTVFTKNNIVFHPDNNFLEIINS